MGRSGLAGAEKPGVAIAAALAIALAANAARAQTEAADHPSYSVGAYARQSNIEGGWEANTTIIAGSLSLPLSRYLVATLGGTVGNDMGKQGILECARQIDGVVGGLFLRDHETGYVGLSHETDHARACSWRVVGNTLRKSTTPYTFDHSSISAGYYFPRLTLRLDHAQAMPGGGYPGARNIAKTNRVGASYYPQGIDAAISVATDDKRHPNERYWVGFEYQPACFDRNASLMLDYVGGPASHSFTAGIRYFFDNRASLIVRARRYE